MDGDVGGESQLINRSFVDDKVDVGGTEVNRFAVCCLAIKGIGGAKALIVLKSGIICFGSGGLGGAHFFFPSTTF